MSDNRSLLPYVTRVIKSIGDIPELPLRYNGKVRECYDLPDGRRIIITTDRLSAFDRHVADIPFKGQILTRIAESWFEKSNYPSHFIECPDPNIMVVERLTMIPVEIVVRNYLTGSTETSLWPMYERGERTLYGHVLPDALRQNEQLPGILITPTTKGADHDVPLTAAQVVENGLMAEDEWQEVSDLALGLFEEGQQIAAEHGLILVDTKYEFGQDSDGRIIVADEIHTPDSSRYWFAGSYQPRFEAGEAPESFDKDVVRRWIAGRCNPYHDRIPEVPPEIIASTAEVYREICEKLTGEALVVDEDDVDPTARVLRNLRSYLAATL